MSGDSEAQMANAPSTAPGTDALKPTAGEPSEPAEESNEQRLHGRVGVVDIGSNTVRLVVYDVPTRLPIPIFNEKAQCALGAGLGRTGRLNPKGIDEALRSLARFVRLAAAMGVDRLQLVATAAVRDAIDGPAFVARVERACGRPVHVLSGAEEARLAAVGLLNGTPGADGVLGDLGGGSLDLVSVDLRRSRPFRYPAAWPPAARRGSPAATAPRQRRSWSSSWRPSPGSPTWGAGRFGASVARGGPWPASSSIRRTIRCTSSTTLPSASSTR